MEKWLSGRKRFFAKEVNLKRVPRVRIPPSPPSFIDICPDLPIIIGKSKIKYGKSAIQVRPEHVFVRGKLIEEAICVERTMFDLSHLLYNKVFEFIF